MVFNPDKNRFANDQYLKVKGTVREIMGSYPGLFVAFEGIDGSGKSTQLPRVKEKLQLLGHQVHLTNEPSSGKLGPILRQYLSDKTSNPAVDALLFAADRVEHYETEVLPALHAGKIVITDRYKPSSIIYQGMSNLSEEWIRTINNQVPEADLTIYLSISAEEALNRVATADRTHLEKFETADKLSSLLERYNSIEIVNRENIDAEQDIEKITEDIVTKIVDQLQTS